MLGGPRPTSPDRRIPGSGEGASRGLGGRKKKKGEQIGGGWVRVVDWEDLGAGSEY